MNILPKYLKICLFLLYVSSDCVYAWDHSVDVGYGFSHDPNHSKYNNSGFLLTSDIYPLRRTKWTFWSITGAFGQWHSNAPVNQNLTTAAASLALRFYMFNLGCFPAYILGSAGPAVLSNRKFGLNSQAANLTFQWNAGVGMEFNHIDANLRWSHFSNAYLAKPDQGFNVLYLFSIGYLF